MNLVILTPEQKAYQGIVNSVQLPGVSGKFEILNNHAPLVTALVYGKIRVIDEKGQKLVFNVNSGFVEIRNNEVSVMVQSCES